MATTPPTEFNMSVLYLELQNVLCFLSPYYNNENLSQIMFDFIIWDIKNLTKISMFNL